jgi:hypothetical protein
MVQARAAIPATLAISSENSLGLPAVVGHSGCVIPATRYATIRSAQPAVTDRFPGLQPALDQLARISDAQYEGLRAVLSSGHLYMQDLLVLSLISRSLELIDGFISAIHGWRFFVASPLVRLQADNLARMHLGAVTSTPDELVVHIADGQPLNRLAVPQELRDSITEPGLDTRRFSDRVLIALASQEHPWLREVYDAGSSWGVHHSSAHMFTTWSIDGANFAGRVPVDIDQFDEDFVGALIEAMNRCSAPLVKYLREWADRKAASPNAPPISDSSKGWLA